MSKIVVVISTDHSDPDLAMRSIEGALKRAGYNFKDYDSVTYSVLRDGVPNHTAIWCDGLLEMMEPEVDPRANLH